MKNFIFISLFLFSYLVSFAQVQNYTFSSSLGAYTPITGGTVVASGTAIDAFNSTAINVAFTYNCTPVTSIRINADGHIGLGTYISTTNYTPLSGTINASVGILSVLGRDLASTDVVGANSEIRYETVGNEFVVQWTDMRRSGTTGERINFQIRINTSTNIINYVYGPYTAGVSNINQPQIGLKGINNIFPANVNNVTLACGATGWLGVASGTASNSTVCLSSVTFPASGTTFTWTPGGATISGTLETCVGGTSQLTGSGTAAATNPWVSSNTSVATVSATGLITSIAQGTSNITYTNSTGCQVSAIFTVNANPTVTGSTSVCVGGTSQLTGTGTPASTNAWVSSNASVATVSNTGLVTGVAAGTANITYTNSLGCSVVTAITINSNPTVTGANSVCVGSSTQLTGTATAATTNAWVSSNTSVATVSNTGLVSGVSAGTATITYTNTLGCTTIKTITVNANPTVTGVVTFCVGSVTQLTGSGTPATTNPWVSSNATIASVSNTGLVTGVASGNAIITYTNNNGCSAISNVIVNANPTVTGANSVCIGATTQLTGTATAATTNAWVSSNTSVATVSNTGLVSGVGAGTASITYTNNLGCTTVKTITVNANNTITLSSAVGTNNQTRCINTALTNITYSTTGATGATVTGLPAGVTGSWASNVFTISGTPSATGTFNYTVTMTGGCTGGTNTATGTIIVNPNNTIALSSAAGTNNPTLCINTVLTNITYSTTGATGATVTGLPAGVTGSWASNVFTISGAPSVTGTFNYTVTMTGGCTGGTNTATGTIIVNPNNTIALSSAAGTNNQTRCVNTALTNITYSTTGATGATVTGLPAGVTGSWSANVFTISGTPSASGTFNYTVTMTGGCTGGTNTATGTITVNANPTVTGTTSLCVGSSVPLTGSGTPAASNAWVSSNASVATVSNIGVVTGIAAGTATITYTNNNGCSAISIVTVNANPTVTGSTSLCVGGTSQLTGTATAATTNAWVSSNTSVATVSNTGLVSGVAAGTASITYTNNLGCTTVKTITVNANNTITLSSAVGTNNQTRCINTALTNITYSTTGATGATVTGLPAGVTGSWASNVFTISGTPSATGTFNYTVTMTGGCTGGTNTATGTIIVNPNNTIALSSAAGTNNPTLCINTVLTNITYSTTGATGATVTGLPAGVTGSWASNVFTISGAPSVTGTFNYTVTMTGGCTGGTNTATGTIIVNPNNTIALSSAAGTNNQTRCVNTALTNITYSTTGATGATVTGLPAGVTGSWSANVFTISGTPSASGTFNYTVTMTGGCTGGTNTATGTITVNANPTVTGTTSLCVGSSVPLTGSGTPAASNAWVSSNASVATVSNIGVVTGIAAGTATITYTNNNGCSAISIVTVNANPTVTGSTSLCVGGTSQLTGTATAATTNAWVSSNTSVATVSNTGLVTALTSGTTIITYTNNNGCQASATITVTNSPSASISYVGSPFCSSLTAAQPVTLTGTTGGTYSSTAGLSLSASTGTITPSSSTPGTYTVNYTSPASGGCSSVNTTTTVTISATPTASISYSGNSFCSSVSTAQSVTLTGTGSYTGGTYSSAPSGLTINTTTGAITPSTSAPGTYTITYTTLASGGCSGITATTQVTVSAVPTASISYTGSPYCNTIASSQSVTLIGTGSYTGGVYSSTAGLTINPSTGSITPSTSSQGTYIINYTSLASGGCPAVIATTTVTISATPTASISYSGSSFCTSVSTAQLVTLTGTGSYTGGTYSSTTGLTLDAGTGAITPLTSTPGTYIITYTTPASGGCSTITATTTVTITAIPTASITYSNTSYCTSTTTAQSVSLTGTGSYTGGTYSSSTGLSLSASTGAITPSTSTPGTYTIIYTTPASGGCSSVTTTTTVTINPSVETPGTITGTATLCEGSTSQTYSLSAVANATTYSWTVPSGWTITSGAGTNSIVVTPGTAGQNGLISVTAGNACGTSQASTLQVAVNALPTVNAGSDTTVCANDFPISLTATGNATTYSWNTGANTATTTITAAGTYTVTGTLNGCSSTDNVVVISDPCAGIQENQELTFLLYPNPSNAVINITANSDEQFDFSIFSMDGKLMIVGVMNNGVISISVNQFAPGKYFTKIGAKVIAFEVTQ